MPIRHKGVFRHRAAFALLALVTAACGGARSTGAPTPADRGCSALTATPGRDSATVVLTWPVDPRNATRPTNPGERFVFELGYATLVRVDCLGRVMPALASSWTVADDGMRLHLVLSDSARFWSADRVTAADVIGSWRAAGQTRLADNAVVLSAHVLRVDCNVFGGAATDGCPVLTALGHAELAVARRRPGTRWAEGTGSYVMRESPGTGASLRTTLDLEPVRRSELPRLTIHSVRDADARDLVDAGAQLVLTDDPALAAYASARSEMLSLALPWDRTWAFVTAVRAVPTTSGPPLSETDPDTIALRTRSSRATLARDVVRSEARASEGPYWWRDLTGCVSETQAGGAASERPQPGVVVRSDQPTARALAERLVALAPEPQGNARDSLLAILGPPGVSLDRRSTVIVLPPNDFAARLRAGREAGYIVSMPRYSLAPCLDAERLRAAIPWLVSDFGPRLLERTVPLVDTRLRAVVRRDWLGLTMTWDTTVTVIPH